MDKKQQFFLVILICGLMSSYRQIAADDGSVPVFLTGCGSDDARQLIFKNDPGLYLRQVALENTVHNILEGKSVKSRNSVVKIPAQEVYSIPVVVHVIHNGGEENISDAQIQQGLSDLNNAFKNTGAYKSDEGVDCGITFCLAQQDESGKFTTGITRNTSALTNMVMENQDLSLKNIVRWNPEKYINIWIVSQIVSSNMGKGVSGYAYFPSSHGSAVDGIVIEAGYFGTSDDNSKLLIHEAGHYLGLYHTFQGGCTNNDCSRDGDKVCDTPPDASTAFTQCSSPLNTCTTDSDDPSQRNPFRAQSQGGLGDQTDLIINYMDYGDARCQTAFTRGQSDRGRTFLETARQSLLSSEGCQSVCVTEINPFITPAAANVNVQTTVSFTNTTTGATGYIWDVNGQVFSFLKEPDFMPTAEGIYRIRMTAFNDDEACTEEAISVIEATCPVKASFTSSRKNILPGDNIDFTNTSTGSASIQWLLDGMPQGTQPMYSHTFTAAGTFTVGLIATSAICSDTAYMVIRVGNCVSKRGNVWHFGVGAGLDFTNDTPVEITSPMNKETWEGCSSICDTDGTLLFSTNGKTVWTNTGGVMPDGTGLLGRASSAQSSLIIPVPDNDDLYYIFTVDGWEANPQPLSMGLRYSVVDMRLNNGNGAIVKTQKNIPLHTPTTEQLGAVIHCNGKDVWVMAHEWGSNNFVAYLVTKDGVLPTPVISKIGALQDTVTGKFPFDQSIATLKFSHNGKKLAAGLYHQNFVELFDFDNSTGKLSNAMRLNIENAYGLEFSPDLSKLYVSSFDNRNIYQVDLSRKFPADSIITVWSDKSGANTGGSLQLAPNGKIYYAGGRGFSNTRFLRKIGVINSPNEPGKLCNYNDGGILLTKGTNNSGLPNFVQSIFFDGHPTIRGSGSVCLGSGEHTYTSASLECNGETSFLWDFKGDILVKSTSTNSATVEFLKPGTHQIIVTKNGRCGISRDTLQVGVYSPKPITLGNDITMCQNETYILNAGAGFKKYYWQDGSSESTFTVRNPGKYWVYAISDGECIATDTIEVFKNNQNPTLDLSTQDTIQICEGSVLTLNAGSGFKTYKWHDGADTQTYTVFREGQYNVTASDYCGRNFRDSVFIKQSPKKLSAPTTISLCPGDSIRISANTPYPVVWTPAIGLSDPFSNSPMASPTENTMYTATTIEPNGCVSEGIIEITMSDPLPVSLSFDNITAEAGTENISIPVRSLVNTGLPVILENLTIEMEYNPSVFEPLSVSKGIFKNIKRDGKTYLQIQAGTITVQQPREILFSLNAIILAGDSTIMPLQFDKVTIDTGCVTIAGTQSGQLNITGCALDKRRIEFNEAVYLIIAPNPANEEVELSAFSIESGDHTIKIFDVQGKNVWQRSFKNGSSSLQTRLRVDIFQFAEGTYQVVLYTPTITKSEVLHIVR